MLFSIKINSFCVMTSFDHKLSFYNTKQRKNIINKIFFTQIIIKILIHVFNILFTIFCRYF